MVLLCTQHDPEGRMSLQTEEYLPILVSLFSGIIIAVTDQTDKEQIKLLKGNSKVTIITGGDWATGYNLLLKKYLEKTPEDPVFITMWDKILHWIREKPEELKKVTNIRPKGMIVGGRTKKAWDTYPRSWKDTEAIINRMANRMFSWNNWDWFVGNYLINQQIIPSLINEGMSGFDFIFLWPKIVLDRGYELNYRSFEGLTFEDPDRFENLINKLGRKKWEQIYYDGGQEWKKRVDNLALGISALEKVFPR